MLGSVTMVSFHFPADASAEISVPATPLRFGSLPSELIHPVPTSVDAALDKLNGVPSKPDKLSGSDAPQPPAVTSSAASSAADSAEPGEARVPAAVGQLLSSLFGAVVSSQPPSEAAPSEQQSDSAAEMSLQAADNGASLPTPPAEQQQLQQHVVRTPTFTPCLQAGWDGASVMKDSTSITD